MLFKPIILGIFCNVPFQNSTKNNAQKVEITPFMFNVIAILTTSYSVQAHNMVYCHNARIHALDSCAPAEAAIPFPLKSTSSANKRPSQSNIIQFIYMCTG